MIVAYLQYERGFDLNDLFHLFNQYTKLDSTELLAKELIREKLGFDQIILPALMIHPTDLLYLSEETLTDIPIRIHDSIKMGFSQDAVQWIKENVSFTNCYKQVSLKRKYQYEDLHLFIFETSTDSDYKLGREDGEHVDGSMVMLEISLDDMNPELYGYIMEKLFQIGANDVYINQVLMKKNRPGQVLHVLCQAEKKEEIITFIFRETTTLGVRFTPYTVHRLEREYIKVMTPWEEEATVKIGKHNGEVVQLAPEYNDCVLIAEKHGIPVKLVYDQVKMLGYTNSIHQK